MGKKRRIKALERRFCGLEESLGEVVDDVLFAREEVKELAKRIDALDVTKRVAINKTLDDRFRAIEGRINTNDSKWSALSTRVGHVEGDAKNIDVLSIKESLDRIDKALTKHGIVFDAVLREERY